MSFENIKVGDYVDILNTLSNKIERHRITKISEHLIETFCPDDGTHGLYRKNGYSILGCKVLVDPNDYLCNWKVIK